MTRALTIILVFAAVQCFSQAMKKANTITITTSDPIEDVYMKFEQYLDDEGYLIQEKEELIKLKTSARHINTGPLAGSRVYVMLLIEFDTSEKETRVILTGDYFIETSKAKRIVNRGPSNLGVGLAWSTMNELAIRYPGGRIQYSIE